MITFATCRAMVFNSRATTQYLCRINDINMLTGSLEQNSHEESCIKGFVPPIRTVQRIAQYSQIGFFKFDAPLCVN